MSKRRYTPDRLLVIT